MTNKERFNEFIGYAVVIIWLLVSVASAACVFNSNAEGFYNVAAVLMLIGVGYCCIRKIRKLLRY